MGNLCDSGTKPDEIHEVDAQAVATTEVGETKPVESEAKPEGAAPAEAAPEPPPDAAPAAAAPAAAPAADGSFTVSVVKAEGKTLKTGIKNEDGKAVVSSIAPDGLIAEYNAANPGTAVTSGDIILSVNGTSGDATAITNAIKGAAGGSTLTIVLKRPVSTTKEFTIELVKEGPLKVGFKQDGGKMVVNSIADDGPMAAYNKANAATALAVGDCVLEVNGNASVTTGIQNTATGAKIVMKVKRG